MAALLSSEPRKSRLSNLATSFGKELLYEFKATRSSPDVQDDAGQSITHCGIIKLDPGLSHLNIKI